MDPPSELIKKLAQEVAAGWPDPDDASDPESTTTLPAALQRKLLALLSAMRGYIDTQYAKCKNDDSP